MSDGGRPTAKFPLRLDRLKGHDKPAGKASEGAIASAVKTMLRPQAHLAHAHSVGLRNLAPTGLGLDSAGVRRRLVLRLREGGVHHEAVLAAFDAVPRHLFVDAALVTQAYEDTSLPIGHGQTISKPSVVARMIEMLFGSAHARGYARARPERDGKLGHVLEIGTGCGYQAALLAHVAKQVTSVERLKPLHDKARELLAPLRSTNMRLVYGDGMRGHAPNAPYDAIIAAAGGAEVPPAWLDQLAVGGRLVSPVRAAMGAGQVLIVIDRTDQGYERSVYEPVKFVPLKSGLVE